MAGRATPARVDVKGDNQLRTAFKHLQGNVADLREVHREAGQEVESEARTLVPIDTGRLRDTIRLSIRLAGSKSSGTQILAGKGSMVPYAGPIHFGWRARNIEPQPFLYDALDNRRDDVRRRYDEGVESLIKRFDIEAPN